MSMMFFQLVRWELEILPTSSAVLYSLTRCGLDEAVGRGSGVNDEGLALKKKIIFESCVKYNTFQMSPLQRY